MKRALKTVEFNRNSIGIHVKPYDVGLFWWPEAWQLMPSSLSSSPLAPDVSISSRAEVEGGARAAGELRGHEEPPESFKTMLFYAIFIYFQSISWRFHGISLQNEAQNQGFRAQTGARRDSLEALVGGDPLRTARGGGEQVSGAGIRVEDAQHGAHPPFEAPAGLRTAS